MSTSGLRALQQGGGENVPHYGPIALMAREVGYLPDQVVEALTSKGWNYLLRIPKRGAAVAARAVALKDDLTTPGICIER